MRNCPICSGELADNANLCQPCADALPRPPGFCAEQLLSSHLQPTGAALVDCWGRVHQLESLTPIGRRPVARGLSILEASVSRNHAELSVDESGTWSLRDVGSSNGTMVEGEGINTPTRLHDKAKVCFGTIGLYFLADVSSLQTDGIVASTATIRPEDQLEFGDHELDVALEADDGTFAGFPKMSVHFYRASAGGGIVEMAGKKLQLTPAQFDLLEHLVARMREGRDQPMELRGFSPSPSLMESISWDTPYPTENHLKQLIRRVRKLLDGAGFGTMIESRRGFGYRIRCIPKDSAPKT